MVETLTRTSALRRSIGVALACSAVLIGAGQNPAAGTHTTVTAVSGSAFGYWSDNISLFGGVQPDRGPAPTVALAADASNSPQGATAPTGLVAYSPATLFTSDTITLSSAGSLGTTGSVTTTSDIRNVNYASTQAATSGSEVFGYPPPEPEGSRYINFNPDNVRTRVAGSATASGSGVSGSTTITNGMLRTHHQSSTDCVAPISVRPCGRAGEEHTHDEPLIPGSNPEGVVTIPTSPPPNYKVAGHLHLGATTTDYFVLVFNEQGTNPDGSITVTPVHEYFGYKLDGNGNLVKEPPNAQGGSVLQGQLYLGQITAGVTNTPAPNAAPVAGDDAYNTAHNTALTVPAPGVLGNDTDADGGTLTAGSASDPAGGGVVLNADGSFTYTPDAGFSGADTFTYTVTDDHGATDSGTVTVFTGAVQAVADGTFTPLTPVRILDTRSAAETGEATPIGVCTPSPCARVGAGSPVEVQVTDRGGIPSTGVSSVVMNVTVTGPSVGGFLKLWPGDQAEPSASSLNYQADQTVPNLVTVKLSPTGTVKISHNTSGDTNVIADVAGWYSSATGVVGARFNDLDPARVLDTRTAAESGGATPVGACTPSPCARVAAGAPVEVQVTGRGGVPSTGVTAVVMNVAVTGPTAGGFLRVWPADAAQPNASNLNYVAGETVPNLVTVKLSPTGTVKISHNTSGDTHVIADVAGWFNDGRS